MSGFSRTVAIANVPSICPGSAAGNVASFVLCPPPPLYFTIPASAIAACTAELSERQGSRVTNSRRGITCPFQAPVSAGCAGRRSVRHARDSLKSLTAARRGRIIRASSVEMFFMKGSAMRVQRFLVSAAVSCGVLTAYAQAPATLPSPLRTLQPVKNFVTVTDQTMRSPKPEDW